MKSHLTQVAALAATGLLLGSPALATTSGRAPVAPLVVAAAGSMMASPMDHSFVMAAARGGNAEISMARLALKNSSNPAVKSFARKMIHDHTAAGAKLAAIVASMGGPPPPAGLSAMDASMRMKLAPMSGAAFDTSYMKGQVAGHKKMEATMQKEASMGANPALKNFATATLPTVQMHLSMAQKDVGMMMAGSK